MHNLCHCLIESVAKAIQNVIVSEWARKALTKPYTKLYTVCLLSTQHFVTYSPKTTVNYERCEMAKDSKIVRVYYPKAVTYHLGTQTIRSTALSY